MTDKHIYTCGDLYSSITDKTSLKNTIDVIKNSIKELKQSKEEKFETIKNIKCY